MKRKEYQRPSILVIEAEVQQPIASSNVNSLQTNPWEPEPGDGTIEDN
ncbi:hypothetical protein [Segatella paludivivens]|nr:hypothetical protein [Segatella paludivivens]